MNVTIYPSKVSGFIKVTSSKSIIHRALIASALSNEYNEITNVDLNEDIYATINGLKKLGAKINVFDKKLAIIGFDINDTINNISIDANESGSTLRFLIPITTYKAATATFIGSKRLMERPLDIYKDLYDRQGLVFLDYKNKKTIKGKLNAKTYKIKGDVSSQFITGLLFLLPLLSKDSRIEVIKPFESKSYVDLTVSILRQYGIKIKVEDNHYFIKANQKYEACNIKVETDYSQAAFFMVLAAINNDLVLKNLEKASVQGDKKIIDILKALNVKIEFQAKQVKVFKSKIGSGVFDLSDSPDLGPILCVLGLFTDDYIKLENVKRLRLKESDRLFAMKTLLEKIGARVDLNENSITVYKLESFLDKEFLVDGYNDHRIVMSMAILATVLKKPLTISGAQAVDKSYPNFFRDLNSIWVKTK